MRPRATMKQWPSALWRLGSPQSETEILFAIAQFIVVVWWRAIIHFDFPRTCKHDNVTLYRSCDSILTKSQTLLHCHERYPVIVCM